MTKKNRGVASVLLGLTVALVMSVAFAANRTTVSEFDFPFLMPAPCLGENVLAHAYVTARGHEFTTPSGTYHMIDNWKFLLVGVGESTGREWIGKGLSPSGDVIHKTGEKYFFTQNGFMNPVSVPGLEDGPKFRFNQLYQARWDADGNLVMEMLKGTDPNVRCLGKK